MAGPVDRRGLHSRALQADLEGLEGKKDLNDADAEEKIAQTEASDASVCDRCGERRDTSSKKVTQRKLLKTEAACRGVEATPACCTKSQPKSS